MAGWVRLHRKSMKSRVWANDGLWKAWCYCLMRANHNEQIVPVQTGRGLTEVAVKRGQFIYGRKAAAKVLRCPESTCHLRMKKLAKLQNITLEPSTHYTLVTVCAFETYNHLPTPNLSPNLTTNQQPTDNQPDNQPDTDKNVIKEVKKNDKEKKGAAPLPSLPESLTAIGPLWLDFLAMRREIGKPLKPTGAKQAIAKLETFGAAKAAESLRNSIAGQWQGIFEPDERKPNANRHPIPAGPGQKYDGTPLGKF